MILLETEIVQTGGFAAKKRILNNALKDGFHAAGDFWYRFDFPVHFTARGARQYGFSKRSKRYMIRKAKTKRHQDPFVWSGKSKQEMMRGATLRATSRGVVVRPGTPKAIRMLGRAKVRELDCYTEQEGMQLRRVTRNVAVGILNADISVERKVIR